MTSTPKTRRCSKCGEAKVLALFDKNRTMADGVHCQCKSCRTSTRRAWYNRHRQEQLVRAGAWYEANREYADFQNVQNKILRGAL